MSLDLSTPLNSAEPYTRSTMTTKSVRMTASVLKQDANPQKVQKNAYLLGHKLVISFCSLAKEITLKMCRLCVCDLINKRSFWTFCVFGTNTVSCFWEDCALHVYRISYLGSYVLCECSGRWWACDKCTLLLTRGIALPSSLTPCSGAWRLQKRTQHCWRPPLTFGCFTYCQQHRLLSALQAHSTSFFSQPLCNKIWLE